MYTYVESNQDAYTYIIRFEDKDGYEEYTKVTCPIGVVQNIVQALNLQMHIEKAYQRSPSGKEAAYVLNAAEIWMFEPAKEGE